MPPASREPQPALALLLQCLRTKLAQDRAHNLFHAALNYLDAHSGADDAALVGVARSIDSRDDLFCSAELVVPLPLQDQPSAEDVWAPCIAWLLKSIPGLMIGPGEQQQEGEAAPQPCSMPLSELLDTCSIRCVVLGHAYHVI